MIDAAAIAARVPLKRGAPTLIAVDGVDGSGKTTFAERLRIALLERVRFVQIVHLDDFHNLREVRYRRGRHDPEGIFAHRDELYRLWDWSVFLDVPFETSVARMAERDGSPNAPDHPSPRRYVEGQRIYLERCDPKSRASLVLDNS